MIKIGNNDTKLYIGGSEIEKVYLGTEQVYGGSEPPTPSYDEQYLTFVAKESGTFKFIGNSIDYSIDSGNTWTTLASDTNSPTVASGGTIMWKASGLTPSSSNGIGRFSSTGMFDVQGNVMSLVYGDNFSGQTTIQNNQFKILFSGATHITSAENMILPATTLASYCYNSMFYNCTSLTTAPELPSATLANGCYYYMFNGCTSLTTAPALPATTLATSCYQGMFIDCSSLTTAPELPATTLANSCYLEMFAVCTSLTTAPVLPATTLATLCYQYMFEDCASLNYIKCLATDISASWCTDTWLSGVAANGTFVKAASMNDWTRGTGGIPDGWTVENDGEPTPSYDEQYFTTESLDDGNTISFTMGNSMTTAITTSVTSVSVSTDDGATWTSMENIGANASLSVTLDAGEKAIWKGVAKGYSQSTATTRSTIFSSTGDYKVYGNILSLLYGDDFERHTHSALTVSINVFTDLFYGSSGLTDASNLVMDFEIRYADNNIRPFRYMFRDCTNLTNAPELKDIEFSNSEIWIFRDMFQNCTSLVAAPALPATTLSEGCYAYMFRGCTSLATAPALPATTLANVCYRNMFYGCTSLTRAPELPATTLATSACTYMFYNCTSLNYIKCLAINISAVSCTTNWVEGVAANGTFVKNPNMSSWTTGFSGIPDGWMVENDGSSDLEPDPTPPIDNPDDIE